MGRKEELSDERGPCETLGTSLRKVRKGQNNEKEKKKKKAALPRHEKLFYYFITDPLTLTSLPFLLSLDWIVAVFTDGQ